MGLFDAVKEAARRRLTPTAKEREADEKKAADERKARIASYRDRAKEVRAKTSLLKAERQRDRFLSPPPSFDFGGGSSFDFGFSPPSNDFGFGGRKARRRSKQR